MSICLVNRKHLRGRVRMYVCVYVCFCMYVCLHACVHVCMYVCMYVWMYVSMLARRIRLYSSTSEYLNLNPCMYPDLALRLHSHLHRHLHLHLHLYLYLYRYLYLYLHLCLYLYLYVRLYLLSRSMHVDLCRGLASPAKSALAMLREHLFPVICDPSKESGSWKGKVE